MNVDAPSFTPSIPPSSASNNPDSARTSKGKGKGKGRSIDDTSSKRNLGRDIGNLNDDSASPSYQYAAKLFERLELMQQLRSKYLKHEHTREVVSWMSGTQVLPTFWGTDQDVALLHGCEKHGYGAWAAMRTDPDLKGLAEHVNDWEGVRTGTPGPPPEIRRGGTIVTNADGTIMKKRRKSKAEDDDDDDDDESKKGGSDNEGSDSDNSDNEDNDGDTKMSDSKNAADAGKKEGGDAPAATGSGDKTPAKPTVAQPLTPAEEKNIVKFYRDMDARIQKRFDRMCNYLVLHLPALGEVPVRQVSIPRASSSGKRSRQSKLKEGGSAEKRSRKSVPRRGMFEVPRDENGKPIFPITVNGSTSVVSLGKIKIEKSHPAFHTKKYIWPVGFKSIRPYNSMRDITKRIEYTCEILDIDGKPHFSVTPDDDKDNPIVGSTATSSWSTIVRNVNDQKDAKNKRNFVSVSGPEWFGFSNPAVAKLIEELPDADKLPLYSMKYQNLDEDKEGGDGDKKGGKKDGSATGVKIKINPFLLAAAAKNKNAAPGDQTESDSDEAPAAGESNDGGKRPRPASADTSDAKGSTPKKAKASKA
eukprot:TRINITY_DN2387_c0_g1_i2.p1 TRINITY_DN2387_c0_g1~~TRINITY_DN2387_c0_g1_i2.p1  ORF type:complete len:587 (-),score=216.49 TRINITY_DN2387_c0_g1_i2:79-1839(-)